MSFWFGASGPDIPSLDVTIATFIGDTWHHHLYLCICAFGICPPALFLTLLRILHSLEFTRHHWNEISLPLMITILSSFMLRQCNLQLRQNINQLKHARTHICTANKCCHYCYCAIAIAMHALYIILHVIRRYMNEYAMWIDAIVKSHRIIIETFFKIIKMVHHK